MDLLNWKAARTHVLRATIMIGEDLEAAYLVLDLAKHGFSIFLRRVEHGVRHPHQGCGADARPQLWAGSLVQEEGSEFIDCCSLRGFLFLVFVVFLFLIFFLEFQIFRRRFSSRVFRFVFNSILFRYAASNFF